MSADIELPQYVESFFRERLVRQLGASNCTIQAYRDGLKLLINYIAEKKKTAPQDLRFGDLSRGVVIDFLDYLEVCVFDFVEDHLGNAVAPLHGKRFFAEIKQDNADDAAVIRIDGAGGIEDADGVMQCETAAGSHLRLVTPRDREPQSRCD